MNFTYFSLLLAGFTLAVISSTMGWILPPSKFISDFSHVYSRLAVIHYTPNNSGEGMTSAGNYIRSLR
jgi:hypothetical protein